MPPWLSNLLLVVAIIVIAFLVYRIITSKRWIRLYIFSGLAMAYFAAPAFKLVIKAYGLDKKWGFDVDAAWNESSWTKDAVASLVFLLLFILENNFTKGESHQKYFHEFTTVVIDNIRDGIEHKDIAKRRKIPLEKVEAISSCIAWLELNQHKKRPENGNGDEGGVSVG
jgi:hypothetical protein